MWVAVGIEQDEQLGFEAQCDDRCSMFSILLPMSFTLWEADLGLILASFKMMPRNPHAANM